MGESGDVGLHGGGSDNTGHPVVQNRIHRLMTEQPYGVLCTQGEGRPYGSLIAFVVNPQLSAVVFITPIGTHKFRLLEACDRVALVVDNRATFRPEEIQQLDALTATGRAVQMEVDADMDWWRKRLIEKHPQMEGFICAPQSAMFRIDVTQYTYVSRLQEVEHWVPPTTTP
jgi:hypothetical protein